MLQNTHTHHFIYKMLHMYQNVAYVAYVPKSIGRKLVSEQGNGNLKAVAFQSLWFSCLHFLYFKVTYIDSAYKLALRVSCLGPT